MEKELTVRYQVFSDTGEMSPEDRELINAAMEATSGSYAPYSNYNVGAAVRLENGLIVKGANQENAAYPSGLCAERTAMFAAGAQHPTLAQVGIAICACTGGKAVDEAPFPCGACRQVMAEYRKKGGKRFSIIVHSSKITYKFNDVEDILPFIFCL